MIRYYKLTDEINKDEIVKSDNGEDFSYSFGAEAWVKTDIMKTYRSPDEKNYGKYVELSKGEAYKTLRENHTRIEELRKLAVLTAHRAHMGQVDKGGNPYISHPIAVAALLRDTEQQVIAYLHDVVEDTDMTFEELLGLGFTQRIVNSVKLLTKQEDVSYEDYILAIKKDNNACAVKIADITDNMDLRRIPSPRREDFERIKKYKKALAVLQS